MKCFFAAVIPITFLLNSGCKKQSPIQSLPNSSPVAKAGPDIFIALPDDSALLSGKSSNDPDSGDSIVAYEWMKIYGPASFSIDNGNDAETKVRNLSEGEYVFELTVADKRGLSSRDYLNITVVADTRNEIIFDHLTWQEDRDSIGHLFYKQTPAFPFGYLADSVVSVQVHMFDFDALQPLWKTIGKNGSDSNYFYYKSDGSSVIVYVYSDSNPANSPFIYREVKIKFR
jgi:hypothetical protein